MTLRLVGIAVIFAGLATCYLGWQAKKKLTEHEKLGWRRRVEWNSR